MNKTELIEEAKRQENKVGFSEISRDPDARGVLSAYGIGFLEGGYWMLEKMIDEAVEWLDRNTILFARKGIVDERWIFDKFLDDFKKAMKQ